VPSPTARPLRDLAWAAVGLGGALASLRAVEALRPRVIADETDEPDDDPFRRELPRAYAVSAAAVLVTPLLGAGTVRLPPVSGPLGLGVEVAGVGLRVWAMRELHGHYARTLRVVDEQPVVRTGPYRHVRHPGYLGALLMCVGAALSAGNVTAVALTATAVGTAYQHRMDAEDALLRRDLPGYADYAATTHRLVPSTG
jgi:protein-S-isoprenylcysteine O-methyltransferase Ste14